MSRQTLYRANLLPNLPAENQHPCPWNFDSRGIFFCFVAVHLIFFRVFAYKGTGTYQPVRKAASGQI